MQVRTISADIALLRRQLDEIDARIGTASGKAVNTSQTDARSSADTRALPADTAVVEYWLGKENAIAWVITRDSVVHDSAWRHGGHHHCGALVLRRLA